MKLRKLKRVSFVGPLHHAMVQIKIIEKHHILNIENSADNEVVKQATNINFHLVVEII